MLVFAADTWTVAGAAGSVVAALAALVTVIFARNTVRETQAGRREALAQHRELMVEEQRATDAIEAARQATETLARTTTEAQASERQAAALALSSRVTLQRIVQLERIALTLGRVAQTAREEAHTPPPVLPGPQPIPLSRLPTLLQELDAAVSLYERLGAQPINSAAELARRGYSVGIPPTRVLGEAHTALDELRRLAENDPALRLPDEPQ